MSRKKWTSEKIFTRLLNNKTQKTFWENVRELRKRPNNEVYNKAYKLAESESEKEKIIGIYVLKWIVYTNIIYCFTKVIVGKPTVGF